MGSDRREPTFPREKPTDSGTWMEILATEGDSPVSEKTSGLLVGDTTGEFQGAGGEVDEQNRAAQARKDAAVALSSF